MEVLIATSILPLPGRLVSTSLPVAEIPTVELRVLGFAVMLTLGTGMAFGLLPALSISRREVAHSLRAGCRAGVGGCREKMWPILVVAEVAGSIVLVVSAGLLMRALRRVRATDPGFRDEQVLSLRTSPPMPNYEARASREELY